LHFRETSTKKGIGLAEKSAALLIDEYDELDVQRHAMYCLWMMDQGRVRSPPAWLTASLKGDWLPTVLLFRVDETTFAESSREINADKKVTY
jgi:hypothetical protein